MPTYEFVCPAEHLTVHRAPMSDIPVTIDCPACGIRARRVYGAPHLGRSTAIGFQALDRSARSAHEPEVVRGTHPGTTATARVTRNPLHQRLPRD